MASSVSSHSNYILGIDPGYARVGWAVVDSVEPKAIVVAAECFETEAKQSFVDRLALVYQEISRISTEYSCQSVAIESVYFNTNAKTAINVAHARGVIQLAAVHQHLSVFDYTPLQVKQAIIGYGRGNKQQIQQMLRYQVEMQDIRNIDDIYDAIAVAVTHMRFAKT
jgi:crossover junction endodeoxyribonuclease RuvC